LKPFEEQDGTNDAEQHLYRINLYDLSPMASAQIDDRNPICPPWRLSEKP